jgi:hypothetical protein
MAIFFGRVLSPEPHILAFAWEVLYGWSHMHDDTIWFFLFWWSAL